MKLAKELAEKAVDLVRTHVEGKLAPLLAELTDFKKGLAEKVSHEDMKSFFQESVKTLMPFDPSSLDARFDEIKSAIPEFVKGEQGPQGEPGKDAAPFEVIGEIDPTSKSYPAGTYASFDGGLWKATEDTEGMKGWVCLVDGLRSFDFAPISEREYSVILTRASGKSTEVKINIPALLYRGVFNEGSAYETGDTVTYKGAMWHCNEATSVKPGDGKAWTLAVKRGQDAKGA